MARHMVHLLKYVKIIKEKISKYIMEYRAYLSEYPTPMECGDKFIVPLNITEEIAFDEEGNEVIKYCADLVKGVVAPLTVDTIVQAAIDEDFTDEQQKYIMRHFSDDSDALVAKYKALVAFVTKSAKDGGYK